MATTKRSTSTTGKTTKASTRKPAAKATTRSRKKATTTTKTAKLVHAAKTSLPKVPAATMPAPEVVKSKTPVLAGPALRKKDLLDAVSDETGMKRSEIKPVVDAVLREMASAVLDARELNLPPFGKLKIQKSKEVAGARVTVAKLRQKTTG